MILIPKRRPEQLVCKPIPLLELHNRHIVVPHIITEPHYVQKVVAGTGAAKMMPQGGAQTVPRKGDGAPLEGLFLRVRGVAAGEGDKTPSAGVGRLRAVTWKRGRLEACFWNQGSF